MKKTFTMTLRKLLMLMAVLSLLVSLSACLGSPDPTDPSDEPSGTSQTDATDPTEGQPTVAPTDPEEPTEPAVMGTVIADNLNVRSNPSTEGTQLKQLDINTRVLIIEQKVVGDVTWGRIADGWINMNYVLLDGQEPTPTDPETPTEPVSTTDPVGTGIITASELNIRDGAGTKYDSVGKYKKGDKVTILETKDGWGRTDKGWVSLKYVEMAKEDDSDSETPDISSGTEIESDGKTKVLGYGVVDIGSLNVRSGPGTKYDQIDKVSSGSRYAYYQKSGNWVRIEKGWVSTGYFYIEGTEGDAATGTITTDLNIRKGPGKEFDSVGSYKKGAAVDILHQINGWGYTSKGWISMNYVDTGDSSGTSATITGNSVNIRKGPGTSYDPVGQYNKGDKVTILETKDGWGRTTKGWVKLDYVDMSKTTTGTITASELNIRKGAGKDYDTVGKYKEGDKVEILEVKDGWGRTDKGWISMEYVKTK